MKTVRSKNSDLWSSRELLFARCSTCHRQVPWRLSADEKTLHGSCCGMAFVATPHFEGTRFHVSMTEADMTNVVIISAYE